MHFFLFWCPPIFPQSAKILSLPFFFPLLSLFKTSNLSPTSSMETRLAEKWFFIAFVIYLCLEVRTFLCAGNLQQMN